MFSTPEYSCSFAEKNRRRQEATVVSIEIEVRSRVLLAVLGWTATWNWWGYVQQNQSDARSPEPHARVYMVGKQSMVIFFMASAVTRMRSHNSRVSSSHLPLCILASETVNKEKPDGMTDSMWRSSRSDALDSVPSSSNHPETS